jgi:hypothetical protein
MERREVARNITLTEEEARQYYKAHPQDFMKPATVTCARFWCRALTGHVAQATFNAAIADAARPRLTPCGRVPPRRGLSSS